MINDAGAYVAQIPAWWNPASIPKQVADHRDRLLTFIHPEQFKLKPVNGLLLFGPPGTGKTSVGCAILYTWGKAGLTARFQDFGELMIRVRSSWRRDASMTTEQIMAEAMAPSIILLDDVAKRAAPEDQEIISILVNARINRGKATLVTTNSDLSTAAGVDQFTAGADSRVLERFNKLTTAIDGGNLRR